MTRRAAIIAIGSEMLGPTRLDTNSLKVTSLLEEFGFDLVRKSVVGDHLEAIVEEILFAIERAGLVVITGGLGPTEDDLTREALAKAFRLPMEIDEAIVQRLEARFAARGWKMPAVNRKQANVFPGQRTLLNERGTAPGFHLQVHGKSIWVFPGVPHELEWMMETYLRPWLQDSGGSRRFRRVLKILGLTESGADEKLRPFYDAYKEPLTILATSGQIELHLMQNSSDDIALREKELLAIFGKHVFGYDDQTIESVVGDLLSAAGATLATAESCTGGLLGSRITDVPGSSRYYRGGVVCYDAWAKIELAGVERELIRAHGEVSEEVARALARGVRKRFGATYGVGITGIAGPGGGSEEKPVGTVHIAVASEGAEDHRRMSWPMPRAMVKWFSTQYALDRLRHVILDAAEARSR